MAQAAIDYRNSCKKLRKDPEDKEALWLKQDAEDFFSSVRITHFTKVSGKKILQMLQEEQREIDEQEKLKEQKKLEEQEAMHASERTA